MRKLMAFGVVALLIVALTTAAAAVGTKGPADRTPSNKNIPTVEAQLPQLSQLERQLERVGGAGTVKCSDFGCVNQALTKQSKAIKNLQQSFKQMAGIFTQCLVFAPVTAYGDMENFTNGYLWWDSADPDYYYISSALDFTWGEDPVHAWMWVWDTDSCPL